MTINLNESMSNTNQEPLVIPPPNVGTRPRNESINHQHSNDVDAETAASADTVYTRTQCNDSRRRSGDVYPHTVHEQGRKGNGSSDPSPTSDNADRLYTKSKVIPHEDMDQEVINSVHALNNGNIDEFSEKPAGNCSDTTGYAAILALEVPSLKPKSNNIKEHGQRQNKKQNSKFDKLSRRGAGKWSSTMKGDRIKIIQKRKRTGNKKAKPDILNSIRRNWSNMNVTKKIHDTAERKIPLQKYELKHVIRTLRGQPNIRSMHVYPVSRRSLDAYFASLQSGISGETGDEMKYEWIRLNSFSGLSANIGVRPISLARAGFYYTGQGDKVRCFSCGISHINWRSGDDPYRIHIRISPHCSHATGTDEQNVPIPRNDATSINQQSRADETVMASGARSPGAFSEENPQRLTESTTRHNNAYVADHVATLQRTEHIFVNSNHTLPIVRSPDTAARGQTHRQTPSQAQSQSSSINDRRHIPNAPVHNEERAQMNGTITAAIRPSVPMNRTVTQNTPTPYDAQGVASDPNRSTVPSHSSATGAEGQHDTSVSSATIKKLAPLGVIFDKPKYPAYAVLTVRMSSYSGWSAPQAPRQMAEAGFVYAGHADYTRCFFCGGGLRNWEEEDDPWIEHAKWFPKCAYLRQNKGDVFIQLVHDNPDDTQMESVNKPIELTNGHGLSGQVQSRQESVVDDIRNLPAYQSLIENGYDSELIMIAIGNLHRRDEQTINARGIIEEMERLEEGRSMLDDTNGTNREGGPDDRVLDGNMDHEMKEISSLMEENKKLKRQRLCRICEEEDASIAFLPCSHLVCCNVCSQAVKRCPVCQRVIQGTVKTWLG